MTGKDILVIRFSALGDVAMTLPVIYAVAKANPGVRFTVVTKPFFGRLFINRPDNVRVMGINPADYKGSAGTRRLLKRLGELHPAAVADLHNVLRTWIIDTYFRLKGVKVAMVDKKRSGRRKALRESAQQRSFIERYVDVFRRLGLNTAGTFSAIIEPDATPAMEIKQPAVGLAPFARYFNKTYPPEMMRRVAELLCKRGINVYLFGGRGDEASTLEEWAVGIDGCQSVAGRFTIEEELGLMSRMKAICSMDSANQHLASLVGTPVVTLWGSTTPECGFMPYGQKSDNSIVARVDCQPCSVAGKPECPKGHFNCMRSVSPETIVEKLTSLC